MSTIVLGRANDPQMNPALLSGMFRLRDTVFRERLGWDVESENGEERDRFDDLNPIYMVSREHGVKVHGCWRLLPTTGAYMLKDTFPELLCGERAPSNPQVWELSLFAVAPTSADDRRQANFGGATFEMMQHVVDHALEHDIESYVTVTSVALERMLRKVGVPLRRFGDGRAQRIGRVLSVACWIDINERCRKAVYGGTDSERRAA